MTIESLTLSMELENQNLGEIVLLGSFQKRVVLTGRFLNVQVIACLILSLLPSFMIAEESQTSTAWPGFLGADRDGKSSETGIRTDWAGGGLPVLWKIDSGEGYGIGSAADGRYYHFDSVDRIARLLCLDAKSGTERWRFEYPSNYKDMYGYDAGPRTSPLIDEGRVYIYGVEGLVHCLDADTGEKIWSLDTVKKFGVVQNFFGVGSSPIIYENLLLVMVGGSPQESQSVPPGALDRVKSNGAGVVAFDKQTGKVVYQTIDDLASYSSIRIATVESEKIGLVWMRDRFYGFDPANGKQRFEFPWRSRKLESVNAMTPVATDAGDFFLSDCYEKGSVLLRPTGDGSCDIVWSDQRKRDKTMRTHWNTPVLIEGYLYGCSGRHSSEAELRCVELATGKVMWAKRGLERTTVTAIDNRLIILGERGDLRLIKATPAAYEEETRWVADSPDHKLDYPTWAAPIVSQGRMFVRGKRQVICFDLSKPDEAKASK